VVGVDFHGFDLGLLLIGVTNPAVLDVSAVPMFANLFTVVEGDGDIDGKEEVSLALDYDF